jgi:hypothetical protein
MTRLYAGAPNCYYLVKCAAVREDIYEGGAITEHRWHEGPNDVLLPAVRE